MLHVKKRGLSAITQKKVNGGIVGLSWKSLPWLQERDIWQSTRFQTTSIGSSHHCVNQSDVEAGPYPLRCLTGQGFWHAGLTSSRKEGKKKWQWLPMLSCHWPIRLGSAWLHKEPRKMSSEQMKSQKKSPFPWNRKRRSGEQGWKLYLMKFCRNGMSIRDQNSCSIFCPALWFLQTTNSVLFKWYI